MRVVVTGASGFLGGAVRHRLADEHAVDGLGWTHSGPGFERVDIRDPVAFRTALERLDPEWVIHSAAYRDPDFCEDHPEETERLNVDPVRTLCAILPPAARVAFISTDYVFDGRHPPYREEDPRSPVQTYGRSKARAEDIVRARPGSLVLRIPLLIGIGADFASSGFMAQLFTHHLNRPEPHECDDALVRYPTWIEDVAEALAFLIRRNQSGVFHVSGADRLTRYAAVRVAAQELGREAAHVRPLDHAPRRRAARPPDSHLSTEKIRALGFTQFTPFVEVLRRFAREFPRETGGTATPV
jgi:dTDP-4-dehydrorhamnose reductase